MGRFASWTLFTALLGACSFDPSGTGHGGQSLGPAEGDDGESSAGDAGGGSTDGVEETGGDASGSATSGVSTSGPDTSDPSASGSTAGESDTSDTASAELAKLEISGAPVQDFGLVTLGNGSEALLTVANTGMGDAAALLAEPLVGPFSFVGGSYPGSGGTCAQTLAAGTSCTLATRFGPTVPVTSTHELVLTYDPGDGGVATATRDLRGGGQSSNLVQNPGAENGLTEWTTLSGSWTSTCSDVDADEGSACFYAGGQTSGTLTHSALVQDVDVNPWASAIDAGEVAVEFRVRARSYDSNYGDDWRILAAFRSANDQLDLFVNSGWQQTYGWTLTEQVSVLPNGTRVVRLRPECRKPSGNSYCDAYFDNFELIARPAN